jgi:hypothetical protein
MKIRKIYIDSRFKSSGTDSDFKIQLPRNVDIGKDTGFYITDVIIPKSWFVINENINDKLYVETFFDDTTHYNYVTLEARNYLINTLASEIQTKLNTIHESSIMTFAASYSLDTYKITISVTDNRVDPADTLLYSILIDDALTNG